MIPVTREEYLEIYVSNRENTEYTKEELAQRLEEAVQKKKIGVRCKCDRPIWAIGSALSNNDSCFQCITALPDSSQDLEIDEVCYD